MEIFRNELDDRVLCHYNNDIASVGIMSERRHTRDKSVHSCLSSIFIYDVTSWFPIDEESETP